MKIISLEVGGYKKSSRLKIDRITYSIEDKQISKECPDMDIYKIRSINGKLPLNKRIKNTKTDNRHPNIQVIYDNIHECYTKTLFATKKEIIDFINSDFFSKDDENKHYPIDYSIIDKFQDDDVFEIHAVANTLYWWDINSRKLLPDKWLEFCRLGHKIYTDKPVYKYVDEPYDENIPIVLFKDLEKKFKVESTGTSIDSIETVLAISKLFNDDSNRSIAEGILKNADLESEKDFPYVAYLNYLTGFVSGSQTPVCKVLKKKYVGLVNAVASKVSAYSYNTAEELQPAMYLLSILEEACGGYKNIPEDILQEIDEEYKRVFCGVLRRATWVLRDTQGVCDDEPKSWYEERIINKHKL